MMENLLLVTADKETGPVGPKQMLFEEGTYELKVTKAMLPMHILAIGPGGGGGIGKDGQKSCVRILFGEGRAFPSTNTHDIE